MIKEEVTQGINIKMRIAYGWMIHLVPLTDAFPTSKVEAAMLSLEKAQRFLKEKYDYLHTIDPDILVTKDTEATTFLDTLPAGFEKRKILPFYLRKILCMFHELQGEDDDYTVLATAYISLLDAILILED